MQPGTWSWGDSGSRGPECPPPVPRVSRLGRSTRVLRPCSSRQCSSDREALLTIDELVLSLGGQLEQPKERHHAPLGSAPSRRAISAREHPLSISACQRRTLARASPAVNGGPWPGCSRSRATAPPRGPYDPAASAPRPPPAPGCSRQVRIPELSRSTSANPRFTGRGFGILEGAEQVHGAVDLGGDGELGVADVDNAYRYVDLGLSTYIGRDWIQLMGGGQLYAGYLQNPTREMVIAGGSPMPPGLVLFEVDEMATGSQSDGSDESCSRCAPLLECVRSWGSRWQSISSIIRTSTGAPSAGPTTRSFPRSANYRRHSTRKK